MLTGVDDLLIEDVTCDTNRDGFDIDCCERVVVRNCRVNTVNDDAIVLKCSYALGRPKPTEHVLIEDCEVSGYDVGSLLDGSRTTPSRMAGSVISLSADAHLPIVVAWLSKLSMVLR